MLCWSTQGIEGKKTSKQRQLVWYNTTDTCIFTDSLVPRGPGELARSSLCWWRHLSFPTPEGLAGKLVGLCKLWFGQIFPPIERALSEAASPTASKPQHISTPHRPTVLYRQSTRISAERAMREASLTLQTAEKPGSFSSVWSKKPAWSWVTALPYR